MIKYLVIVLSIFFSSSLTAFAKTPLTKTECVWLGRAKVSGETASISNQVFESLFYMVYKSQVSCEVNPNTSKNLYKTLDLAFGLSDSNSCSVKSPVTLYLDGKAVENYELVPGELKQIQLKVFGVRSVSIKLEGPSCGSDGGVHFVDATLR